MEVSTDGGLVDLGDALSDVVLDDGGFAHGTVAENDYFEDVILSETRCRLHIIIMIYI